MKTILKYLLILTGASLLAGLFYFKVYIPKTSYKVLSPKKGNLEISIHGIGNVNAQNIYNITTQSGGKILHIYTEEAEWVKKGDLLIEMDGVDLPDQKEIAKATLKKAEYELIASKSELQNQKIQKELIKKTYNRYTKLNEQGYAAQSEYDKAYADLQSINSLILVSKSHINSAKAQILLSQKSIKAINTKINNLKVYAPVDGYVITKDAEVTQNVLPTHVILKIVDASTLWVETKVDERVSGKVKIGQVANIILSSQPNRVYKGIVKRILPVSDMVTLEREVDVAFVNIPKPFYINEQAEIEIYTQNLKNILKIPMKVIVQNSGKIGVWILKDQHANFKEIKKIAQNTDFIAISNLNEKSLIIVPDSTKKPLSDGLRVY